MKKAYLTYPLLGLLLLCSCSQRRDSKAEKEKAYAEWTESLNDSIEAVKYEIDSCQSNLDIMHDKVSTWLRDFTYVENSREVEGYTIFNGWQGRYPLQSTGLVARITKSEGLELIAAYAGAPFTSISVSNGTTSVSSDVVPHDQALNYRRGNLTTVLFTGEKADSIAQLISDNELNNIKVTFIASSPVGSYSLPNDNKKMISATWLLYDAQKNSELLERRIPILNEKIKILRQAIDRNQRKNAE